MTTRTIEVQIQRDGGMCFVPVPFNPKAVFGKVRVPVRITLNGYSYRSTIASMAGMTVFRSDGATGRRPVSTATKR